MSRTVNGSEASPRDGQQMDRSNDPETTAALDEGASESALESRQRLTGSAVGVGSIGFDEAGAFDVGAGEPARKK